MSHLYPLAVCCRSFEAFTLLEAEQSSLVRCWHLNSYKDTPSHEITVRSSIHDYVQCRATDDRALFSLFGVPL